MKVAAALNDIDADLEKLNRAELKKLSLKLARIQAKVLKLLIKSILVIIVYGLNEFSLGL